MKRAELLSSKNQTDGLLSRILQFTHNVSDGVVVRNEVAGVARKSSKKRITVFDTTYCGQGMKKINAENSITKNKRNS